MRWYDTFELQRSIEMLAITIAEMQEIINKKDAEYNKLEAQRDKFCDECHSLQSELDELKNGVSEF